MINHHLKRYDDLARVTQKFAESFIGLDYLEKRVKRLQVNYDFFNFKVSNFEEIQNGIMNISSMTKEWEINNQENILVNLEEDKNLKEKKIICM